MLLDLKQVTKRYQGFELNCSLQLKEGCVTGLIGANGAGKSTTFKTILGLITPDDGTITVMGKTPRKMRAKEKQEIGVVLSDSGFSGCLMPSGVEKILSNLYPDFDKEDFRRNCRRFEIPMDKKLTEFSTGMSAKFKLLVALSHKTRLLVLDEPTAGLDVMTRTEILDILREYMLQEDRGILISSHIASDLEGLCDDLYLIDKGSVLLHEDTDVLMDEYGILKVTQEQFERLDKRYLFRYTKQNYGYCCLTKNKRFYQENAPQISIEKGGIDEVMQVLLGGTN